eukprot:CAMPEP_0177617484 /NCGR_PEP_ID=MMETSP0419_2-20121207/24909_1 /TAXON_ID=582737 /ORGANISM="Tetraselmis sp., Strain GSL018" /LENGTH=1191 /DNA_ID=CAMNT_0019116003 /DNA_START=216 /DNA_END=3787 /DNA_ORIENTATION=+
MDIQEWILERFSPAVMVLATPEAEAMCQEKNGLSVTDMLRPYGTIHNISVPVRTVGEQSYRINGFNMRLYDASTMFQPSFEASETHLSQLLHAAVEKHGASVECSVKSIRQAVWEGRDATPWFTDYRREMLRLLSFTDFETYDHPVACLLVASGTADDLPDALQALDRPQHHPILMQHGVMDPSMLRGYLLLYDDSAGSEDRAEMKLSHLRSLYGLQVCHKVKINSACGSPADSGGVPSIWRACLHPPIPGGGAGEPEHRDADPDAELGACLSGSDLEGIALFMKDFAMRNLLPHLENRIRMLNHQITSTRRGLKNSLKALWWRKERPAEDAGGQNSQHGASGWYAHSTPESQMRALSDMAFMLHDYGLAASTLRLLQGDYRADKAMRHYAAAQEMLALCNFMLGEIGGREVEDCLMQAYQAYGQCGPQFSRFATRAMLHLSDVHQWAGRYREAKSALMKAHFEESHTRAALLLEQSAVCLLKCEPPLERKFAFHLVLAGLRFHQCDQRLLAERAYRQVLSLYEGKRWYLIEEHLNDILSRYARDKGEAGAVVRYCMGLAAGCAHRAEAVQEHYMKLFCGAVQQEEKRRSVAGEGPLTLDLPLPVLDPDSFSVYIDGVRYKGNPEAHSVAEGTWDTLHESLSIGGLSSAMSTGNWLAGRSARSMDELNCNVCCAHEDIGVDMEFKNPLGIALEATGIRLLCDHEAAPPSASSSSDNLAEAASAPAEAFRVKEQDLSLRAKEQSRIHLEVRPLVPGVLRVRGVEWCLNGSVRGRCLFNIRSEPRWRGDSSPFRLTFNVIPPMPRLCGDLAALPSVMYAGEVMRCPLILRNDGDVPLKGIKLVVSHPAELYCGSRREDPEDGAPLPDLEAAWREEAEAGLPWERAPGGAGGCAELAPPPPLPSGEQRSPFYSGGPRVWRLPKAVCLEPGEETRWPLWVSPRRIGTGAFQLAVFFESGAGAAPTSMRHRVLCLGYSITVVPAIKAEARILRNPMSLHSTLLQLSVQNTQTATEHFHIRQVSCLSPGLRVQHLGEGPPGAPPAEGPSSGAERARDLMAGPVAVGPGETSTLLLHLWEGAVPEESEPEAGPPLPMASGPPRWFLAGRAEEGDGASLAVVWELPSAGRGGRRLGTCLAAPAEGQPPGPAAEPLRAVLRAPSRALEHSFASDPLCEAELTLVVASGLDHPTSVTVECG